MIVGHAAWNLFPILLCMMGRICISFFTLLTTAELYLRPGGAVNDHEHRGRRS